MLKKKMIKEGDILFKYRSYLPLIILPVFVAAMGEYSYPFNSYVLDVIWAMICMSVAFGGLAIRIMTVGYVPKGTSGRNTKKQAADELNISGAYSIVRHPLYLGNFLITIGTVMLLKSWWLMILVVLLFFIYYERIMLAEEEFLLKKFSKQFSAWAEKTPAFIPNFKLWRRPQIRFSSKAAIRREYHGFSAIITVFTVIEVASAYFTHGTLQIDMMWSIIFSLGLVSYLVIRSIAKFTTLLNVENRY